MPITITGQFNNNIKSITDPSTDYKYNYPYRLKLKPGTELHNKLVKMVLERAQESRSAMSARYDSWRAIDKKLTAYIDLTTEEETLKDKDINKPLSIVVPTMYAALETLLTYLVTAFLDDPILKYEGFDDQDVVGAALMELLISNQALRSKLGLRMHTWFRDMLAYGFGAIVPAWTYELGYKTRVDNSFVAQATNFLTGSERKTREEVIAYEGNDFYNIDPYLYFPDPNTAIPDVKRSDYQGWLVKETYTSIINRERTDGRYFNGQYLRHIDGRSALGLDESLRDRFKVSPYTNTVGNQSIHTLYFYINLIPNEWGLGRKTVPEKWVFGVSGDAVLVCAYPSELNHNQYPVAVIASEYDGYTAAPISRLEMVYGLQEYIDYLFNCYDDKTEVLTSDGWVGFPDLKESDKVATVLPGSLELTFEQPKQLFEYDYDGTLIQFKSSRMDVCVTPNHNLVAKKRYKGEWEFLPASFVALNAKNEYKTLGNLSWEGEHLPKPIVIEEPGYDSVEIPAVFMVDFLGWFVSEGSITHGKQSGSYTMAIKQVDRENAQRIDDLMDALPFHVTRYFDEKKEAWTWSITHKGLYNWLKKNCYIEGGTHSEHKRIPTFAKNLDTFYLERLFNNAMRGDGNWHESPHDNLGRYASKSKQLINDMQEIALKLGYFSHVHVSTANGLPFYSLNISTVDTFPAIAERNCSLVDYKGKVYCFENSTHITVTRRNGKIGIHGQSHIVNVRKAINDVFVVDPQRINLNDVLNPSAGGVIRTRRQAWGTGVKDAIEQLKVTDITQASIQEALQLGRFLDMASGTTDVLKGDFRQGERISATEYQGTKGAALTRLERMARVVGMQGVQDLGTLCAENTQQFMSQETYVKIVGRHEELLRAEYGDNQYALVGPMDILTNYDIVPSDGTIPNSGDPQQWLAMFQTMASNPELLNEFDIVRVFKHWARLSGEKNLNDFVKSRSVRADVRPAESLESGIQAGNIVPLEELSNV